MKLETLLVDIECDVCLEVVRVKPECEYGEITGDPATPIPGWDHDWGDTCPECLAGRDPPGLGMGCGLREMGRKPRRRLTGPTGGRVTSLRKPRP